MSIFLLDSDTIAFPPPDLAEASGLLAVGGDLSIDRLLAAYRAGIFPWYAEGEPTLWWSPDPRLVLFPGDLRVSARLRRLIRGGGFALTMDTAFEAVIRACATAGDRTQTGTWITGEMVEAYCRLHRAGYAHSVEAWRDGGLAGGLYGVSLGRCFFGESMFTGVSNASKVALVGLVEFLAARNFDMIDCQMTTAHLMRFGAVEVRRSVFLKRLAVALQAPTLTGTWRPDAAGGVFQRTLTSRTQRTEAACLRQGGL
ncbi:MAG: leucyl/phenylalanyl-tRNA--protein transferase [Thermodesulfobacteriota bacterium]